MIQAEAVRLKSWIMDSTYKFQPKLLTLSKFSLEYQILCAERRRCLSYCKKSLETKQTELSSFLIPVYSENKEGNSNLQGPREVVLDLVV